MTPITVRPTRADLSVAKIMSAHTGPRTERAAEFLTWGADEHILCALAVGAIVAARMQTRIREQQEKSLCYLREDLSRLATGLAFCLASLSCLDGAGCVALTGSEAGKVSLIPF